MVLAQPWTYEAKDDLQLRIIQLIGDFFRDAVRRRDSRFPTVRRNPSKPHPLLEALQLHGEPMKLHGPCHVLKRPVTQ
jgi:hypothetical protein